DANEDYFVRICPEMAGDTASLVFKFFETQQGADLLEILNGNMETSPSLGVFSGNVLPGTFTSSDPSGCLMLHFTSNATVHRGGWEAEIVCASTGTNAAGNFEGIFEAFPNPASSKLNVSFTYPASEMAIIRLLDLTGRQVLAEKMEASVGSNLAVLDLAGLPSGTYFVSLTGAFGTAVRRVVKE
ncbi:MAG: T9SS type A sorting domain-containing protein, partial [Bacteroidota bacterium]